jgi:hypothetical protein
MSTLHDDDEENEEEEEDDDDQSRGGETCNMAMDQVSRHPVNAKTCQWLRWHLGFS